MGKASDSQNEDPERKAGYGCELAPKIPEGNYLLLFVYRLASLVYT